MQTTTEKITNLLEPVLAKALIEWPLVEWSEFPYKFWPNVILQHLQVALTVDRDICAILDEPEDAHDLAITDAYLFA